MCTGCLLTAVSFSANTGALSAGKLWCAALHSIECLLTLKVLSSQIAFQALVEISGLTGCPCLEQLWLAENDIKIIDGLDGCRKLRCLYLYSNQISTIQKLDHLCNLEVIPSSHSLSQQCMRAYVLSGS